MVKQIYSKGTAHNRIEHYDVLILGAGPAGLTAAIYCARYKLKTAVVAKSIGGTANLAGKIENWPGYFGSGKELMKKFYLQAKKFGAHFLEAEVNNVEKDENGFVLELKDKEIHGKSLIIALGTENRKLDVPGEKEFVGKGVSYCATCDGNFFKGKRVVVIGGADSAAKAALYLSDIAKKIYLIYRREEMRCEPISFEKIKKKKNIEIMYHVNPVNISGDDVVKEIEILQENPGKKAKRLKLKVDGIFIEIGATPVLDVIKNLDLSMDYDYIRTNCSGRTNVAGVFAAGDVSNNNLKQVVTAAGEGALAAKGVFDFLKDEKEDF